MNAGEHREEDTCSHRVSNWNPSVFFEPTAGVWREEAVKDPAGSDAASPALAHGDDDEDFEAFCRRSLL